MQYLDSPWSGIASENQHSIWWRILEGYLLYLEVQRGQQFNFIHTVANEYNGFLRFSAEQFCLSKLQPYY